jgi:hypothetical protein
MTEQDYYNLYGHPPRGAVWAASAVAAVTSALSRGIEFISDQLREVHPLDEVKTPEDLINYAYRIRDRDPSFSDELIALAQRAQG